MSARVVGIGGIFFKARDPEALQAWYRDHLGLTVSEWGGVTFDRRVWERSKQEGMSWGGSTWRSESAYLANVPGYL